MTMLELIEREYHNRFIGMAEIPVPSDASDDMKIIKVLLGENTDSPYFGKMLVILNYKNRYFRLMHHVWAPNQRPADAHRMCELDELFKRTHETTRYEYLVKDDTDFGLAAFRLYTPDSELDEESRQLRKVAKILKDYAVSQELCKQLRKTYTKGNKQHA